MDLSDPKPAAVVAALEALEPEIAASVRERWADHADDERPLLVLFGPHNSGKSNLIRRLLIDAGHGVPEWLRASARPEDTSGETVELLGWRVLDLPGIGSEQARHDERAWDALELADAVLLVMSLKLLSGDALKALEIINGSWWSANGQPLHWPPGGLTLIVARVDAGPADPEEDPEDLEDLKIELEPALDELLSPVGGRGDVPLFWVAASPGGILGRKPDAIAGDLDGFRSWDGMAELTESLESSTARVDELRDAALVRFLSRAGKEAKHASAKARDKLLKDKQLAHAASATRQLVEDVIDAAIHQVQQKLDGVVTESFAAMLSDPAAHSSPDSALAAAFADRADAFEADFQARLLAVVDEIERLVEALPEVTLDDRPSITGSRNARADADSGPGVDTDEAVESLRELGKTAAQAVLGRSVDEAKEALNRLKAAKDQSSQGNEAGGQSSTGSKSKEEWTQALENAGFSSDEHAKSTERIVKSFEKAQLVLEAAPQVIKLYEFAREVYDGKADQKRAAQLAARQKELVSALTEQLLRGDPSGYEVRLERLRTAALSAFEESADLEQEFGEAIAELDSRLNDLDGALTELDV